MRRIAFTTGVLALAAAACLCQGPPAPPVDTGPTLEPSPEVPDSVPDNPGGDDLSTAQIDAISRASVQIIAAQPSGNGLEGLWVGSGTIISPDGEILTNCHVACAAPVLIIAINTSSDLPPEPTYLAEVTHFDEALDLAIIRITSDVDGNPVQVTNLPFIEVGDSNSLRLGERIYIFGYPTVGGDTITFTTGSVSGFESASVGGQDQRVVIKTDASIAGGNSGGTAVNLDGKLVAVPTAVNPDVREGVTIGSLSVLLPINLINVVRQQAGSPPESEKAVRPDPGSEPDSFEPNETIDTAYGPVGSGDTLTGYLSWEEDADVFYFNVSTTQPITLILEGPGGADYDLYLSNGSDIIDQSESETSSEAIEHIPSVAGTYYAAVLPYSGATPSESYRLTIIYDGGSSGGNTVVLTGTVVDGATGRALAGGVFGVLNPGVTCNQFFSAVELDFNLVTAAAETSGTGAFRLDGVPVGNDYSAFFVYETSNPICENDWLSVPSDGIDTDLGQIDVDVQ